MDEGASPINNGIVTKAPLQNILGLSPSVQVPTIVHFHGGLCVSLCSQFAVALLAGLPVSARAVVGPYQEAEPNQMPFKMQFKPGIVPIQVHIVRRDCLTPSWNRRYVLWIFVAPLK